MKKLFTLAAIVALAMPAMAQDIMVVNTKDGQSVKYSIDNIKEIVFEDSQDVPDERAIDLGLPSGTLWASMNIGSTTEAGTGLYLSWGETAEKVSYDEDSYSYEDMIMTSFAGTECDPATVLWGSRWTTPTKEQWDELIANTIMQKSNMNGVDGLKIRSKTSTNFIFLPYCGQMIDSSLSDAGYGWYWASTQGSWNSSTNVGDYFFSAGTSNRMSTTNKRVGQQVRPVQVPKKK